MPPKKGKKGKGKKGKAKKEGSDNEDNKPPAVVIELPFYGWIRLELRLCDPPVAIYNTFKVVMRSDSTMIDLKKKIVAYHGRVENICIYNFDPIPLRN
jgi:hypothetical protein